MRGNVLTNCPCTLGKQKLAKFLWLRAEKNYSYRILYLFMADLVKYNSFFSQRTTMLIAVFNFFGLGKDLCASTEHDLGSLTYQEQM